MAEPGAVTLETFVGHIGDAFPARAMPDAVTPAGEPIGLALIEAISLGESPGEGLRAPFSLMFRAPGEVVLGQGMYRLQHPTGQGLDIFLVPVTPDAEGVRYQAVFA